MAIRLTVAELERYKTNMNTKEKHIIRSILNPVIITTRCVNTGDEPKQ